MRRVTEDHVALADLAEATQTLSRALRRDGERAVGLDALPGSEVEVLQAVLARPEVCVTALARTLGLQASNVSTTVRALVGRGLVERVPDPADGRRTLLRASAEATRHRELLRDSWARTLARSLEDLPDADAAALRAAVPTLVALARRTAG